MDLFQISDTITGSAGARVVPLKTATLCSCLGVSYIRFSVSVKFSIGFVIEKFLAAFNAFLPGNPWYEDGFLFHWHRKSTSYFNQIIRSAQGAFFQFHMSGSLLRVYRSFRGYEEIKVLAF
jgi:hypothetical protein